MFSTAVQFCKGCYVNALLCGLQLGKLSLHQTEADQPVETLPELTAEQIANEISTEENFRIQITKLEEQLGRMKPNLAAIAEYRKKVGTVFI